MANEEDPRVASVTQPERGRVARRDPAALGPGEVLAGRYEIRATLGRGGTGVVMRAYDRVLREEVAIKVLRPEYAAERRWVDRLAREVKLARQIRHPNVCRVFNFEQADGHTFVVMEQALRGTLRAELDSAVMTARTLAERLADARAIAGGLAAIHDAGIIHRDVTPQNVLRMADGRLVVSDFGLAIGVGETTTSIQGGTLAYMAPEVVRGDRASFAADVWSLGVVLHEVVFGGKPRWRSPTSFELVTPTVSRTLTRDERMALEACRACTDARPVRRPSRAGEVAARLGGGGPGRWLWWSRRWLAVGACAFLVLAGVVMGIHALRLRAGKRTPVPPNSLIAFTGEPRDWTETSRVLVSLKERVSCVVALPDAHTVRAVWGPPNHAEDLDIRTGRHVSSPIVPEAYRYGCPDVSATGRLLFQGYMRDGRSFAFVSRGPNGAEARPVVAIEDPSLLSEPRWLADGRSFVFDADSRHAGVYSMDTERAVVLPSSISGPVSTFFKSASGMNVFVRAPEEGTSQTEVEGITWPSLDQSTHFLIEGFAMDLAPTARGVFYVSSVEGSAEYFIVRVDPSLHEARRIGFIRGGSTRFFTLVEGGAVVASVHDSSDLWIRGPDGGLFQLTHFGDVQSASHCGSEFLVSRRPASRFRLYRIGSGGKVIAEISRGDGDEHSPTCSRDGNDWYLARWRGGSPGIYHCRRDGCDRLTDELAEGLDLSPDGRRIVYLSIGRGGLVARWIWTTGGPSHLIDGSETSCSPGWSSPTTVWMSRQRAGIPSWVEIDVETGALTGRVAGGTKTCADGWDDLASPVHSDIAVVRTSESSLRYVAADQL